MLRAPRELVPHFEDHGVVALLRHFDVGADVQVLASLQVWNGRGRDVLNGKRKKKVFRYQFSQKSPRALHVFNHGWWQLAVGGWRRLAVGSWQLAVGGGWWWLAAVGGWRLVVGGGWQWLAVGGWSPLAVGGGWWLAVGS